MILSRGLPSTLLCIDQRQRCHSCYSYGGDYATLTISGDKKSTLVSPPPESDSKVREFETQNPNHGERSNSY
ncbi:unnamed protein product [Brassica rapa subsp. trilocularis]